MFELRSDDGRDRLRQHSYAVKLQRIAVLSDLRSNMIRMAAVGGFYAIHLLNYSANSESTWLTGSGALADFLQLKTESTISSRVHLAFSLIAVTWIAWAIVVHRSLFEQRLPGWIAYATASIDIVLLTAVLVLSAGAQNPLVCGYLLIVMMVAMRMDLKLVWWATTCGLLGLLTILAAAKWPRGLLVEYPLPVLPRHYQLMWGFAIVLAGLTAGQWVRFMTGVLRDAVGESTRSESGG